jgi:hypothetical protein
VLRVRKRDGGAEYAAKVLTDVKPGQAAFSHEQLSELKALFKARARGGAVAPERCALSLPA